MKYRTPVLGLLFFLFFMDVEINAQVVIGAHSGAAEGRAVTIKATPQQNYNGLTMAGAFFVIKWPSAPQGVLVRPANFLGHSGFNNNDWLVDDNYPNYTTSGGYTYRLIEYNSTFTLNSSWGNNTTLNVLSFNMSGGVGVVSLELATDGVAASMVDAKYGPGIYYSDINISGNPSALSFSPAIVNNVSLPLTLLSFVLKEKNCTGLLEWKTMDESNTSHFEIEQGFDGINYRYVKSSPAQGDGPGKSYSASVDQPISKAWYRLKMVDRDGRFKYSPVRLLETSCTSAETLKVYPHPATASTPVFVELISGLAKSVQIQIMNSSGTIVRTIPAQLAVGTNRIELNKQGLLAGTYILRMISKETMAIQSTRFVIL